MLQPARGRVLFLLVGRNVDGIGEVEPRQVFDGFGLRGREEQRLSRRWQIFDYGIHGRLEAHVQAAVRFVEDKHLQVGAIEQRVRVHVLQQPTRSADDYVQLMQPTLLEL